MSCFNGCTSCAYNMISETHILLCEILNKYRGKDSYFVKYSRNNSAIWISDAFRNTYIPTQCVIDLNEAGIRIQKSRKTALLELDFSMNRWDEFYENVIHSSESSTHLSSCDGLSTTLAIHPDAINKQPLEEIRPILKLLIKDQPITSSDRKLIWESTARHLRKREPCAHLLAYLI